MQIDSIFSEAFVPYGKVLRGYDTQPLMEALCAHTPLPADVTYVRTELALEALPVMEQLRDNAYGGMPIQLGWCNGHNTQLNCLEYHRDSELNLGTEDFILLLALQQQVQGGQLHTDAVRAFSCPAGTLVELYATTLHYAPCSAKKAGGFRVMVALPRGTNGPKPAIAALDPEDAYLWACNKWLLAHPDSSEAAQGAHIGLLGENIDIQDWI